jgi:sulfatase-like protein
MRRLSRRDFLKLGTLLSGAFAVSRLRPQVAELRAAQASSAPSVFVFVFDAMSATNLSLYGYKRKTTPNLERFAQRATVYNQHYSPGNFTTPGTASLLTGMLPWTHRAINEWGLVRRDLAGQNLFRAIGPEYFRLAYSQNMFPNFFFGQFEDDIENVLSPAAFSLVDQVVAQRFGRDLMSSHRAFDDFLFQDNRSPASLVFGLMEDVQLYETVAHARTDEYPNGLPHTENYPIFFKLKDVFDGLIEAIRGLPLPGVAYLHTWSPHTPYLPTTEFDSTFRDGWSPKPKPEHVLGDHTPIRHLNFRRQNYDEYIANLDAEFGRVMDFMEAKGLLENSYVIVTSDHGEFFERGVEAHHTPLLYEAVVRVPLLISSPGQTARQDVYAATSSIDILPTLMQALGREIPAWCEGRVLPGFGTTPDGDQSIFLMEGRNNRAMQPMSQATFALRKGPHKLIYYKGYEQYDRRDTFELYKIDNDPEELNDLYSETLSVARDLRGELVAKVAAENSRFDRSG